MTQRHAHAVATPTLRRHAHSLVASMSSAFEGLPAAEFTWNYGGVDADGVAEASKLKLRLMKAVI
eukprot:4562699-Pleurochrysis_carterae.AAC.1